MQKKELRVIDKLTYFMAMLLMISPLWVVVYGVWTEGAYSAAIVIGIIALVTSLQIIKSFININNMDLK
jgi:phosphatidylglycerophosphate synthase